MATKIQTRNGTAAQWTTANPLLATGELGVENDTRKIKSGDGVTTWNSLPYLSEPVTVVDAIVDGNMSAVTSNAVFDGMALKAPLDSPSFTGTVTATDPIITTGLDAIIITAGDNARIQTNGLYAHIQTTGGGNITSSGNMSAAVGITSTTGNITASNGNIVATAGQFVGAGTGLTGTGEGFTAGAANGLKSATTTVSVNAATAPTAGQVLKATSSTAATWQETDWTVEPVKSFSVNVKAAPFNASGSGTGTTLSVAMTAGAVSATITSAASFKAGHGINITGAGVAGAAYIGKIVSVTGSVITVTPAISTSVAISGRVRHDDTASIQAAINSMEFTGGSIILPAGVYNVNGPLQDTGGSNSKIVIPKASYDSHQNPLRFMIEGQGQPLGGNRDKSTAMAMIITDGTEGWVINSSGLGTVLSHPSAVAIADCTAHWVTIRNLLFRAPVNPIIGIIGGGFAAMLLENITIDVGQTLLAGYFPALPFTKPTNDTTAVKTPPNSNSANVIIRNFACAGYGNGIYAQEHTDMSNIVIYHCINAIKVHSPGHSLYGNRIQIEHCINAIYAAGPVSSMKIDQLGMENVTGVTVYDPSNQINGVINFASFGAYLSLNGAEKIAFFNLANVKTNAFHGSKLSATTYHPDDSNLLLDSLPGSPDDNINIRFQFQGGVRATIQWTESTATLATYLNSVTSKFSINVAGSEDFYIEGGYVNAKYAFRVGLPGNTLIIKTGTNALAGTVTLASGIGTITSTAITTDTIIMLSLVTSSGTPALAAPLAKVNAGSANITGAVTDNSTYNWIALKKY